MKESDTLYADTDFSLEEERGEPSDKVCLNCGATVESNFCPECGQPASTPQKIDRKNFWLSITRSFTRISPRFFPTCWTLMTRPWIVVKDHLSGKHVSFTGPFTLFIQLTLLTSFILMVEDNFFPIRLTEDFVKNDIHWSIKLILNSKFIRNFIISLPIGWCLYLVYGKMARYPINIYECLVASFYFFVVMQIYTFIIHIVRILDTDYVLIGFIPVCTLGIIGIWKIFRRGSLGKKILFFLIFFSFSLASVIGLSLLLSIVAREPL